MLLIRLLGPRVLFCSRVIAILVPVKDVSVTLYISYIFILKVTSFKVQTQTIRQETGGNYFMEQRIFLLCTSCRYTLAFSHIYFFQQWNPHLSSKTLQIRKKIIIGRYQKRNKKPCLSLMNRFSSLVDVQHFDAQNFVKRKTKKTCSLELFGTCAALQNILKNQQAKFNLILT